VRILATGDRTALARFFDAHPHTTLFLQSNLLAGGLVDRGEPYQGTYAAAFERGVPVAVACQAWNGNLLLEAPRDLPIVVRAAVRASGRAVAGILGPHAQVCAARDALGLAAAAATMDSEEDLFALELAALQVPETLARGALRCRAPRPDELALLVAWRHDYGVETLGEPAGPRTRASSAEWIERYQREGKHWLLDAEGAPVAYTAFNAETPDCVQVGGVWTPPALRGRGYGRAVVAGSLLGARARGVARSVLFTEPGNRAAQAAYCALGYRRVGDYGMLLFAEPRRV